MRTKKILSTLIFFMLAVALCSQERQLPSDSLAVKYHIRKIKVKNFHCDSNLNIVGKGYLNDIYYFNKKSQLIKQKRKLVTYYYKYNAVGQLISQEAKWKTFTHAWWEGGKFDCTTFSKINNSNIMVINEFNGRCHACDSSKSLKKIISYSDQNGRDTLLVTTLNNWYYTVPSDTGRTRYSYNNINKNTVQLTVYDNLKNSIAKEQMTIIKTNGVGQTIETYRPDSKSLCPRFVYQYNGDLLKRKIHFNCLGKPANYDVYEYYFR